MKRTVHSYADVLEMPNYSPIEAVRYFHIPASTLQYWTLEGLVKLPPGQPRMLSFYNLVELYVLEGLRHIHGLNLRSIRRGVEDLLKHHKSRHPLAEFELHTLEKHLIFKRDGVTVNSSLLGQLEVPEWTNPYLRRVDRDPYGLAQRIFPFMKRSQIVAGAEPPQTVVIDPETCFGLPVLSGSRITTGFLASRWRGGELVSAIARSYDRPMATIKEAIEWETGREIAAA